MTAYEPAVGRPGGARSPPELSKDVVVGDPFEGPVGVVVAGVAAPGPVLGLPDDAGTNRVQVDVSAHLEIVSLLLDELGLEPALQEMSDSAVAAVEGLSVAPVKFAHPLRQIAIRRLGQPVMITHQEVTRTDPSALHRARVPEQLRDRLRHLAVALGVGMYRIGLVLGPIEHARDDIALVGNTELGGEIVVATSVAKEDTNMVPVLTEIAAGEPDGIYFPIFQPAGDFIVQQVGGISGLEDVQMYGADGLITPDHFSLPETEGVYYSGPDLGFDANAGFTGETYTNLVARYEAAYGELPTAAFHAHTYDATMMLLFAIESVAVEGPDGELWVDRLALRDFLYNISDFAGVTGTLTCDEFGDCGGNVVSVILNLDSDDPQAGIGNVVFRAGKGAGGEVVILPVG